MAILTKSFPQQILTHFEQEIIEDLIVKNTELKFTVIRYRPAFIPINSATEDLEKRPKTIAPKVPSRNGVGL